MRKTLAGVLLASSAVFAQPQSFRHTLAEAADKLEEVLINNREGSRECRHRIDPVLRKALEAIEDFRPSDAAIDSLDAVIATLDELHHTKQLGCPEGTGRSIREATELVTAAKAMLTKRLAPRVVISAAEVEETPQGPVVWVPAITFWGSGGHSVYVASRWHADNSPEWTRWQSFPGITVPPGPQYVWNEPVRQDFDARQMQAIDTAQGHFTVHLGVFDDGKEVSGIDVPFTARRGRGGPPPPPQQVVVAPPPPAQVVVPPPPPAASATDCGTGFGDVGCVFNRPNAKPLNRGELEAMMAALRSIRYEPQRADAVAAQLGGHWLTVRQLGVLLDLFRADNFKLQVARACVPRLMNPANGPEMTSHFLAADAQAQYKALFGPQRR